MTKPTPALAALVLLAAAGTACASEQPDPAAGRTRLTITHSASPTAAHSVVFEVVSQHGASSLANVSYSADYPDGGVSLDEDNGVELPFTKTVPFDTAVPKLTMSVYNAGADDTLICRIRVDGTLIAEESSGGYFNSAYCRTQAGG